VHRLQRASLQEHSRAVENRHVSREQSRAAQCAFRAACAPVGARLRAQSEKEPPQAIGASRGENISACHVRKLVLVAPSFPASRHPAAVICLSRALAFTKVAMTAMMMMV